jgi:hypothetical protein
MSVISLTVTGQGTFVVDPARPLDGGVEGGQLTGLLTALTNSTNSSIGSTNAATVTTNATTDAAAYKVAIVESLGAGTAVQYAANYTYNPSTGVAVIPTVQTSVSQVNTGLDVTPVTPVTVANGATVALNAAVTTNVLRPTSDTTIAGAVINVPTTPVDGQILNIISTGAITTVTGTLATATLPLFTTITAGANHTFVYNTTATKWFGG